MTDQEFEDYWDTLVEKRSSSKAALSSDERLFYAANVFRGSVTSSGVIGYFENTECDVIRDAHHALETLGLRQALKLLQDAQNIVLGGNPLPDTDECPVLFDYDLPEAEITKAMDDLEERVAGIQDQLYLQDGPLFEALCRFADEKHLAAQKNN